MNSMNKGMNCCGCAEYHGMNDGEWTPEASLLFIAREGSYNYDGGCTADGDSFAHVVFTEVRDRGRGNRMEELSAYVNKHKLGSFMTQRAVRNPNTNNPVKIGILSVAPRGMEAWYQGVMEGQRKARAAELGTVVAPPRPSYSW